MFDGVLKLQLDRVLQKAEEAFFLFRLQNLERLAFVAANDAEKMRHAALAPHDVDAGIAHHRVTLRTFVSRGHLRMARAGQRAVGQNGGRRRDLDGTFDRVWVAECCCWIFK